MYTYSFKVKKGIYQLTVSSSDRDFIEEEFAAWIYKTSEYVQKRKSQAGRELVASQIAREQEIANKKINEQLNYSSQENTNPAQSVENKESTPDNDKEKELDIFYAPRKTDKDNKKVSDMQSDESGVFDAILNRNMSSRQTELSFKQSPTIKKDNAYINYMGSRKIERKIDYLLLTAYYLTQFEQKPRFTLKQLNAKLMQNLAVILDHGVIQEGINRDYIECLPDLTGAAGASEYRLTAYGEKVLLEQ